MKQPEGQIRPLFVTVKEACEILAVGRTKLNELLTAGELRARKVGRGTRIETASLEEYAAGLPKWKPLHGDADFLGFLTMDAWKSLARH
jgi:excisionase family DNA binding protein